MTILKNKPFPLFCYFHFFKIKKKYSFISKKTSFIIFFKLFLINKLYLEVLQQLLKYQKHKLNQYLDFLTYILEQR